MIELPQLLKERREAAGLSLQKLGEKADISDSTISKIESGETPNPKWNTVCILAKALNFSEQEFLALAGYAETIESTYLKELHGVELLSGEEISTVQLFVDFLLNRKQKVDEGGNH